MNLLLPVEIVTRLVDVLVQNRNREVGGVLMGEHVARDTFRVKELTIQIKGGTFVTFVRFAEAIIRPLQNFFRTTNYDYKRFNYLGEWHSHHSFSLDPSTRDNTTMNKMIMDPQLGAHFLVLLIIKLNNKGELEHSVNVYRKFGGHTIGRVIREDKPPILNEDFFK